MFANAGKLTLPLILACLLGGMTDSAQAQVVVPAPTVTYYSAPVATYCAPAVVYRPAVTYYTPAVSYYAAPAVSYYAAPTVSYYAAPAVTPGTYVTTTRYGLFGRPRRTVTSYYPSAYIVP